jgi:hypothetical protein
MTMLFGVLAVGVLYALLGAVALKSACRGHCDSCSGSCPLMESDHARN